MKTKQKSLFPKINLEDIEVDSSIELEDYEDPSYTEDDLLGTGSVLLNIALSGYPRGGYRIGRFFNVVGDSHAGKSLLAWTAFAEACKGERFDNYDLIYDEPEQDLNFKLGKLFGRRTKERVKILDPPSDTVEKFCDNLERTMEKKPVIYILDSFDSISSQAEMDRKLGDATYGVEKPKLLSEAFRKRIKRMAAETGSIVGIVSQTRDKIGKISFGSNKTRSGGNALRFYSCHEFWLAVIGHIKRKDYDVGVDISTKIKKNKLTGRNDIVEYPILNDYGIDDISSMVRFLLSKGVWKKKDRGSLVLSPFGDMTETKLVKHIEDNDLTNTIVEEVYSTWKGIMKSIASDRKPKYE